MKVAIPTDDQIKISKSLLTCKGYLIYEIDDHSLVNYEFLTNPYFSDSEIADKEIVNTLNECSSIICNKIDSSLKDKLKQNQKQILTTLEENAKKALINLMCRV